MRPLRLAAVATHPIQYQTPIFRALAASPDVELWVFFASRIGLNGSLDHEFEVNLSWDTPLLEGYRHSFLRNRTATPTTATFAGLDCPDLTRELKHGRFDGVFLPAYHCYFYLQAFWAAWRAGIPILYRPTITDLDVDDKPWNQLPRRMLLSVLYRRIASFLAIGQNARRHFQQHGVPPDRISSAPHCVDNDLYQSQADYWRPQREKTRQELGISPEQFVVLFSGKLCARKDPASVIRAAANARFSERLAVLFVGDGALRGELVSLASDLLSGRTAFVGFQNQSVIGKYYAAADCVVLPSLHGETWGLVVNDAMNFSLPVIVSDRVGCAPDLAREGETGFSFPAGSAAALARRLDLMVSSPQKTAAMGARARALIAEYSPQAAADGIRRALFKVSCQAQERKRNASCVRG